MRYQRLADFDHGRRHALLLRFRKADPYLCALNRSNVCDRVRLLGPLWRVALSVLMIHVVFPFHLHHLLPELFLIVDICESKREPGR